MPVKKVKLVPLFLISQPIPDPTPNLILYYLQFPERGQLLPGVQSGEGGQALSDWQEGGV